MPSENVATLSVDMPAERRGLRIVPQIAVAAGIFGERAAEPGVTVGTLLCLVTLGVVAITTVATFFGAGFVLLAHPREEMLATRSKTPEATLILPVQTASIPPVQTASASEVTLIPPVQTASASEVTLIPPVQTVSASEVTLIPPVQTVSASEVTLIPPEQTASASEVTLSYSASSAAVALPPRPRPFAAKIAKGRATRNAQPGITFKQYRDIQDLRQWQVRLELQTKRLERQKAYYDRLAAMPAEERDRRLRQRFDELDANHDGKLDRDEFAWSVNHQSGN